MSEEPASIASVTDETIATALLGGGAGAGHIALEALGIHPNAVRIDPIAVRTSPKAVRIGPKAVRIGPKAVRIGPEGRPDQSESALAHPGRQQRVTGSTRPRACHHPFDGQAARLAEREAGGVSGRLLAAWVALT